MLRGQLPLPIPDGSHAAVTTVADYLEVVQASFTQNQSLGHFCETMSNGNMREALGFLTRFLSCGHVDADKILGNWRTTGSYTIPLHEFAKAVMLSDHVHYAGVRSTVVNVFDYETSDERETFVVLCALAVIEKLAGREAFSTRSDYRAGMSEAGYSMTQARRALERCIQAELVETADKTGTLEDHMDVRNTPRGQYYLHVLVRSFVYVDVVCIDTPINDPDTLHALKHAANVTTRAARTRTFTQYLSKLLVRYPEISHLFAGNELLRAIEEDVERALRSAFQRRERSSGS